MIIEVLSDLAPVFAIIGFLLIFIKLFVGNVNKNTLRIHIMIFSGVTAILYFLRGFSLESNFDFAHPYFLSIIWIFIGCINYIEYTSSLKE